MIRHLLFIAAFVSAIFASIPPQINTSYAQVITESKANGTEIHYTYGNDLVGDGSHYFLTDALGSTRGLVDAAESITDTYDYHPYGEIANHTGTSQNSFLFTGEQFDAETGDYYLRARYYSPSLARFLSRDTYDGKASDPLSQNHYLYAGGNPIVYVDPSGHMFVFGFGEMFAVMDVVGSIRSTNAGFMITRGNATVRLAVKLVLDSGHSVKALRALRKAHPDWFKGKEIHHILEKRFFPKNIKLTPEVEKILQKLGHVDNMPGIVLTKQRHRVITNRWMEELGRKGMKNYKEYSMVTVDDLINAASKVYRDDPVQLQVVLRGILNVAF